jgi:hypothetical protein
MSDSLEAQYDVGRGFGFWVQVIRALLLLALGLSLIFIPDKTHKMLFNAMGLFWLTTSLVLIRRESRKEGNRLWLVIAVFGALTGLLVITRDLSRQWVPEVWVKGLLGAIILLTGLLNAAGVLSHGRRALRGRPLADLLLGVATVFLGALLIVGRTGREQIVYYVAMVWALLWGGLILYSAGKQWWQRRQEPPEPVAAEAEQENTEAPAAE